MDGLGVAISRRRWIGRPGCERQKREADVPTKHPEAGQDPRFPTTDVHQGRTCGPAGEAAQGATPSEHVTTVTPVDRVTSRRAFASLQRTPKRAGVGPVWVSFVAATDLAAPIRPDQPQVAYAISRRFGGAVQRNRMRRRLRAAVRDRRAPLTSGAYLVAVSRSAADASYPQLARQLDAALDRAAAAGTGRRTGGRR